MEPNLSANAQANAVIRGVMARNTVTHNRTVADGEAREQRAKDATSERANRPVEDMPRESGTWPIDDELSDLTEGSAS